MMDASAFRRIRRRVMKRVAPDFCERKAVYIRETAKGQLHCIEFAPGRFGNEFSVDMGVHFSGLPSFEAFGHKPKAQHPEPDTCCLQRRWRDSANQQLLPYGDSNDDAERLITTIVVDCLRLLDTFNSTWGNGEALLDQLPPSTLVADAAIFKRLLDCADLQERERLSGSMTIRSLLPGWFPHVSPMSIMLAYFAKQFRESDGVCDYLAITAAPGQGHIMAPRARSLINGLK